MGFEQLDGYLSNMTNKLYDIYTCFGIDRFSMGDDGGKVFVYHRLFFDVEIHGIFRTKHLRVD